jgi:acetyltransferase-like isoleucine patch superfamily enzyme
MKYLFGFALDKIKKYLNKIHSDYLQKKYFKNCGRIGTDCHFNGISTMTGLDKAKIGNNVHIGNNAFIRAEGGLTIHDNVHISRNLLLYTHSHNWRGRLLPFDDTFNYGPVIIEKNVWIGMGVTILPGTHIKEGAIISAGAVVSGIIPSLSIYTTLSRQIYARNKKHYDKLNKEKQYGGVNGKRY